VASIRQNKQKNINDIVLGSLSIIAGIITLILSLIDLALVLWGIGTFFGIYFLIAGIMMIISYTKSKIPLNLIFGALRVFLGVVFIIQPHEALGYIAFLIGFWAIIEGIKNLSNLPARNTQKIIPIILSGMLITIGILVIINQFKIILLLGILVSLILIFNGIKQIIKIFRY